jgi:membrane protein implicated in regulation of membrane protease activity
MIFYVIASVLTIILSAIFIKKRKKKENKKDEKIKKNVGSVYLINNIENISKKRKK